MITKSPPGSRALIAFHCASFAISVLLTACGDPTSQKGNQRSSSDGPEGSHIEPNDIGPSPKGAPWTVAAEGSKEGVRWTVFMTPGTNETSCYAIELDPPLPQFEINSPFPPGSTDSPIPPPPFSPESEYLGKAPYCLTPVERMDESDPIIVVYFPPEHAKNPFNFVVGQAAPFVTGAQIILESGLSVKVVSSNGLFFTTYDSDEGIKSISGATKPGGTFSCNVTEAPASARLISGCSTTPPD